MRFRAYFPLLLILLGFVPLIAGLTLLAHLYGLGLILLGILFFVWGFYLLRWTTWLNEANKANQAGQFDKALRKVNDALALAERYGPDDIRRGIILNWVGEIYRFQGRLDDAELCHRKALELRERVYGPQHGYVGESLNNLANIYLSRGKFAEAEAFYQRTLAIFEKGRGRQRSFRMAVCLNNLGKVCSVEHRHAEAEDLFRRSLALLRQVLKPGQAILGFVLNNLALACGKLGRCTEGEALAREALSITEKPGKTESAEVAICLATLAQLHYLQKNSQAEAFAEEALTIREQVLG